MAVRCPGSVMKLIRGRLTKGEIKYDKAASGTRRCVAMPVKRVILVHFVTHPLSEPWNLVVFSAPIV
jgi:hypothetical protein